MSKLMITLNKKDIDNLLLGGEIPITPNFSMFNNLQGIVIKYDDYYDYFTVEEDWNDKERNVYQMHGNFTKV